MAFWCGRNAHKPQTGAAKQRIARESERVCGLREERSHDRTQQTVKAERSRFICGELHLQSGGGCIIRRGPLAGRFLMICAPSGATRAHKPQTGAAKQRIARESERVCGLREERSHDRTQQTVKAERSRFICGELHLQSGGGCIIRRGPLAGRFLMICAPSGATRANKPQTGAAKQRIAHKSERVCGLREKRPHYKT